MLKIDAHDLPTVRLGNSDQLRVGDYVLAIGEPFGLEETATAGIVSAKGRSLPGDGYVPFIQTDAAVNPGNSGGPLFDATGAVVGINAQIYTTSGGYEGVSFAVPINLAVQIKDQIVKTGKVVHARLGVEVQTMDQSLADSFKLKAPDGALVAKVVPGQRGRAGGDQGRATSSSSSTALPSSMPDSCLPAWVLPHPATRLTLEVWRNGKTLSLTATIGNAAEPITADNNTGEGAPSRLGLALRPLNPDERQQAGVSGGLVVEDAQGHAAEAGIQPGDVVLSVDGTPVQTVAPVAQAGSGPRQAGRAAHSARRCPAVRSGHSRLIGSRGLTGPRIGHGAGEPLERMGVGGELLRRAERFVRELLAGNGGCDT